MLVIWCELVIVTIYESSLETQRFEQFLTISVHIYSGNKAVKPELDFCEPDSCLSTQTTRLPITDSDSILAINFSRNFQKGKQSK